MENLMGYTLVGATLAASFMVSLGSAWGLMNLALASLLRGVQGARATTGK